MAIPERYDYLHVSRQPVSDLAGFAPEETDNRQVLRMFAKTFFWSLIGVIAVLYVFEN